jgi:nitrate/nitrite transport system ATP-binding protein
MSNGPRARIAEIVVNTLPRQRARLSLHHDPQYYRIRNHLIDFLVERSRLLHADSAADLTPLIVSPGLTDVAQTQAAIENAIARALA